MESEKYPCTMVRVVFIFEQGKQFKDLIYKLLCKKGPHALFMTCANAFYLLSDLEVL